MIRSHKVPGPRGTRKGDGLVVLCDVQTLIVLWHAHRWPEPCGDVPDWRRM